MDIAKHLAMYVVLIVMLWAGLHFLPYLSHAYVSSDYVDIVVPDVDKYRSYSLDPTVTISHLAHDDVVMFRKTTGSDAAGNFFGWVLALPGETVRIKDNAIMVNDVPVRKEADLHGALRHDEGPILVPSGTVWVGTSLHLTDSLAIGPIPAAAIKGRVAQFP